MSVPIMHLLHGDHDCRWLDVMEAAYSSSLSTFPTHTPGGHYSAVSRTTYRPTRPCLHCRYDKQQKEPSTSVHVYAKWVRVHQTRHLIQNSITRDLEILKKFTTAYVWVNWFLDRRCGQKFDYSLWSSSSLDVEFKFDWSTDSSHFRKSNPIAVATCQLSGRHCRITAFF